MQSSATFVVFAGKTAAVLCGTSKISMNKAFDEQLAMRGRISLVPLLLQSTRPFGIFGKTMIVATDVLGCGEARRLATIPTVKCVIITHRISPGSGNASVANFAFAIVAGTIVFAKGKTFGLPRSVQFF